MLLEEKGRRGKRFRLDEFTIVIYVRWWWWLIRAGKFEIDLMDDILIFDLHEEPHHHPLGRALPRLPGHRYEHRCSRSTLHRCQRHACWALHRCSAFPRPPHRHPDLNTLIIWYTYLYHEYLPHLSITLSLPSFLSTTVTILPYDQISQKMPEHQNNLNLILRPRLMHYWVDFPQDTINEYIE